MKNIINDAEIIEILGGTAKVARIFNVSFASVSRWKKYGIPPARRMFIDLKFKKQISTALKENNHE
jgi:hypothetical protein